MAIYEYFCPTCKQEFEVMRPVSEADEPTFCPKCGAQGEKLISGFASKVAYRLRPTRNVFREDKSKQ